MCPLCFAMAAAAVAKVGSAATFPTLGAAKARVVLRQRAVLSHRKADAPFRRLGTSAEVRREEETSE